MNNHLDIKANAVKKSTHWYKAKTSSKSVLEFLHQLIKAKINSMVVAI